MRPLTDKQQVVRDYMYEYNARMGFTPTMHEISLKLGFKSDNAAFEHVKRIERNGHIEKIVNNKYRFIDKELILIHLWVKEENEKAIKEFANNLEGEK